MYITVTGLEKRNSGSSKSIVYIAFEILNVKGCEIFLLKITCESLIGG